MLFFPAMLKGVSGNLVSRLEASAAAAERQQQRSRSVARHEIGWSSPVGLREAGRDTGLSPSPTG